MESSSRRPDEELELRNKAIDDDDLRLAGGEEDCKEEEEESKDDKAKEKKKKKKRVYTMSQEHVEMLLSYKVEPLPETKTINKLAEEDEETFGGLRTAIMRCQSVLRHYENIVLAGQEKMKHDLDTKGCFTYEATHEIAYDWIALATKGCARYEAAHDVADDDEDEDEHAAPASTA